MEITEEDKLENLSMHVLYECILFAVLCIVACVCISPERGDV